jgi:DNA-binding LacI/PurR family transcriptional regulator
MVLARQPQVIESDPFFAGFIAGVEGVLQSRGYALVLQLAGRNEDLERYRQLYLDNRVDGVFITDMSVDDPRVALVSEIGLAAVAINSGPGCAITSVRQDQSVGFGELVRRVVELGHRDIAHVAGRRGMIHTRQRIDVWRSTLRSAGIQPGRLVYGDFSTESGSRAADRLLNGPDAAPTAVVCANDLMAIGFIARASALGFDVPNDVSVTGFDGIHLGGYVRPALTTVVTSPRELGAAAAKTLLRLVDGQSAGDHHIAPTRLLERDSLIAPSR